MILPEGGVLGAQPAEEQAGQQGATAGAERERDAVSHGLAGPGLGQRDQKLRPWTAAVGTAKDVPDTGRSKGEELVSHQPHQLFGSFAAVYIALGRILASGLS